MKIIKDIIWIVFSRAGAQAAAVLSTLLLARYFGRADFGEYAFISAVIMIGNAFSTFGMDMILIRRLSLDGDLEQLSVGLSVQVILSCIFILLVFALDLFVPLFDSLKFYLPVLLPLSLFTICTIALRGLQRFQSFALLHSMMTLLQLLAVVILISARGGMLQLALLMTFAYSLSALLGLAVCKKEIRGFTLHMRIPFASVWTMIRICSQMALIGTLRLIYEKMTLSLLPFLSGTSTAGVFSAAQRVVDAGKIGHMSALTAVYPEMSKPGKETSRGFGFLPMFGFAGLLSLSIYFFARWLILILFGADYIESILVLKILSWVFVSYFLTSYYSLRFVALGRERPVLLSLIAGIVTLALSLNVLSPEFGAYGAAVSVLLAEFVQALSLLMVWRIRVVSKFP